MLLNMSETKQNFDCGRKEIFYFWFCKIYFYFRFASLVYYCDHHLVEW